MKVGDVINGYEAVDGIYLLTIVEVLPEEDIVGIRDILYLPTDPSYADAVAHLSRFNSSDVIGSTKEDYTLDALPLPCTVYIEGVAYVCNEQPTFTFSEPGTYSLLVEPDSDVFAVKRFSYDYQP